MTTATAVRTADVFGLSDRGKVRPTNQDHFVIATLRKSVELTHTNLDQARARSCLEDGRAHLLAVADGAGGMPGGDLASELAIEVLLEFIGQAAGVFQRFDVDREHEFLESLELAVRQAHQKIRRGAGLSGKSPATTLTMVILVWPRAYLVHAGDSRAYYLDGRRLRRLTQDQTMGEYMADVGAWTDETVARAPTARTLVSALGASELTPTIGLVDLHPGDALLLCSDGLTRHVSDDRIAEVLGGSASAEEICRELVDEALAAGGSDNVTAIAARC